MLEDLVRHLIQAEMTTLEELASRLSTTPDLLDLMLGDLERGGYLVAVNLECDQHCSGCADSSICALVHGKRIWRVTEKGYRLAGQPPVAPAE
jgi:hypothetical protein